MAKKSFLGTKYHTLIAVALLMTEATNSVSLMRLGDR